MLGLLHKREQDIFVTMVVMVETVVQDEMEAMESTVLRELLVPLGQLPLVVHCQRVLLESQVELAVLVLLYLEAMEPLVQMV